MAKTVKLIIHSKICSKDTRACTIFENVSGYFQWYLYTIVEPICTTLNRTTQFTTIHLVVPYSILTIWVILTFGAFVYSAIKSRVSLSRDLFQIKLLSSRVKFIQLLFNKYYHVIYFGIPIITPDFQSRLIIRLWSESAASGIWNLSGKVHGFCHWKWPFKNRPGAQNSPNVFELSPSTKYTLSQQF